MMRPHLLLNLAVSHCNNNNNNNLSLLGLQFQPLYSDDIEPLNDDSEQLQ